jgi:hypothetical protein
LDLDILSLESVPTRFTQIDIEGVGSGVLAPGFASVGEFAAEVYARRCGHILWGARACSRFELVSFDCVHNRAVLRVRPETVTPV